MPRLGDMIHAQSAVTTLTESECRELVFLVSSQKTGCSILRSAPLPFDALKVAPCLPPRQSRLSPESPALQLFTPTVHFGDPAWKKPVALPASGHQGSFLCYSPPTFATAEAFPLQVVCAIIPTSCARLDMGNTRPASTRCP